MLRFKLKPIDFLCVHKRRSRRTCKPVHFYCEGGGQLDALDSFVSFKATSYSNSLRALHELLRLRFLTLNKQKPLTTGHPAATFASAGSISTNRGHPPGNLLTSAYNVGQKPLITLQCLPTCLTASSSRL